MPIALNDSSSLEAGSSTPPPELRSFPAMDHFRVKDIPPAAYYIPDFITPDEEQYIVRKLSESPQPKWKKVGTGRRLQYWGGTMSAKGTLLPEPLPDWLTSFPDIIDRIEGFLAVSSGHGMNDKVMDINQVLVNEYQSGQGIAPHEDGPAFRPLVATLSLGSHTVLDIHHYLSASSPSPPMTTSEPTSSSDGDTARQAGPIAAIPLAHLLLLPRSLLILSSSLYTSHLHGITATEKDVIVPRPISGDGEPDQERGAVSVANAELVGDATVVDALREGKWAGQRGMRTSLTFRHANKVMKGGAFAIANGALRRN